MNFSRIIPDAIKHLLKGEKFVIRSDGKSERDFMYVKDAVSGYLLLAQNLDRAEIRGNAFNFGTETPISVSDLFGKIAEQTGKPGENPEILGTARGEIDRQYLGTSKVKELLGWKPEYTLAQGLSETVEWYENYFDSGISHSS